MNETESQNWHDSYQVGYGPMDAIHEEFVQLIEHLQSAPDGELVGLLGELAAHLETHFEEENRWMRETDFPPRDCHIEQHEAVLESVHEVQKLLARGDTLECRRLVAALADWFPNHTAHLDSALAHWMCKRRFGGKPIVIRRPLRNAPVPG